MLVACLGMIGIVGPWGQAATAQILGREGADTAPAGVGGAARPRARRGGRRPRSVHDTQEEGESFLTWMILRLGVDRRADRHHVVLPDRAWSGCSSYRRRCSPPLVRDVEGLLDQKRYNEAYQRAGRRFSFRPGSSVGSQTLRRLVQAHRAMELANEDATMEMEHRTTYLATVGTLGPMIGLVGTVYGMIMAFQVIATAGRRRRPVTCGGISTALVRHARGDRDLDPGDLLLRVVSQPDRAAFAGSRDDRRAAAGTVRRGVRPPAAPAPHRPHVVHAPAPDGGAVTDPFAAGVPLTDTPPPTSTSTSE